jgi:signal transduction histidine kinase
MAAIGQLAGGVAHELNTPLGAISLAIDGALSVLKTKPDRAESRLTRAASSVQQMKHIVSKLLFYSRDARSGRRETDLNEVIEDTLQLIGHQLMMDNVVVEKQLGSNLTLVANQNELQQIFYNLTLNARDAVLAEGATARKILLTTSEDGDDLVASVRDWGCGMPESVRERIFEPFYTTKEVGKGTGLGLSVTMQLLEQHAGTISVTSSPGGGTEFTLRLPKHAVVEDE